MFASIRVVKGAGVAIVGTLALLAGLDFASAAEPTPASEIIKALKPKLTRSLSLSPADAARNAEEKGFIDTLRNRTTRSLSTDERERVAALAKAKPSIDLEISFEFNSAVIGARATPQVTALGEALTSEDLRGHTFILAGHTDAKGSDTYNQGLSERRADAVKRFLLAKYGIDTGRLVTVGYGKTHLKQADNPFAGENRRVQIVNVAQ
jgi:outer membrane protein OmpA-like peptidoglycan-associated protein